MKRTPKASMAFKELKAGLKTGFGSNVIDALNAQAPPTVSQSLFPDLPVSVSDLETVNEKLNQAVANRINGGRAASIALKQANAEWNTAFSLTGAYISTVAAGNPATIVLGGYIPTKSETTPSSIPGPIADFKATINSKKGAIVATSKYAVPQADGYVFAVTPESVSINFVGDVMVLGIGEETKVYICATTKKKLELYNLPRGVINNVTMYAFNSVGSGPAATPDQVIPQ